MSGIVQYYLRISKTSPVPPSTSEIQIATDPSFSNIVIATGTSTQLDNEFNIVLGANAFLSATVNGMNQVTTFLSNYGCSSLEFVSAEGYTPDEYAVILNPGNIVIQLGETKYNNVLEVGGPNLWSSVVCCIHPDMNVRTLKGFVPIKEVKSGDVVYDIKGKEIEVISNIKYSVPSTEFFKVKHSQIGKNIPNSDLLLTRGHSILHKMKIFNIEDMESELTITKPTIVHNLCTKNQEFIDIEGMFVSTCSEKYFENFSEKHAIIFEKK